MGVTIRSGREGKAKDQALNAPTPPTHSAQPIATTWAHRPGIAGFWVPKKLEVSPFLQSPRV